MFSKPGWLSRRGSWSGKEGMQGLTALPYSIEAFSAKTNIVCSQNTGKLAHSFAADT